jgi:hypothetical protein
MPTHAIKIAPMYSKLCNVYYPPTPSLGWIGQIKGHSLSLASARSAYWLAYTLHPRSLTPIWSWMQGCTKPWTIISHPCPPMNNNIAPMPTQNPWAWVWAPNIGLWFMPRSHQTESSLSVDESVSNSDFHGGPSPSMIYDGTGDSHPL